jgi:hypothetical protein
MNKWLYTMPIKSIFYLKYEMFLWVHYESLAHKENSYCYESWISYLTTTNIQWQITILPIK